jgi:NADH-quinone oxidoreductase subunit J
MAELVTFAVAAVLISVGGLGVIAARNPVHSALFLIQTLIGVAVLFVVQEAHFLAAVQVVVYAGAIVILFLFVIMLLGVDKAEDLGIEPIAGQKPLAAIVGAALAAAGIVTVVAAVDGATGVAAAPGIGENALDNRYTDIERIGRVLFTDYLLAFQITAVLLTIAVIGAVVLTRTVRADDLLDDLDPVTMDLASLAPAGANDGDHQALADETDHGEVV